MTNEKIYRLDKYRIIVHDDVLIRWEAHAALGMEQGGKCFLFNDLLVIGSRSNEVDGFLIGEFHDHLQKLPVWNGTRYYCFARELLDNVSGQSLTDDFLEQQASLSCGPGAVQKPASPLTPGTFKLGHYQITVADDGALSWKRIGELQRIVNGQCTIESEVLCLGPQEYEEEGPGNKQAFIDMLHQLPQWDRTMAWCLSQVLRPCQEGKKAVYRGINLQHGSRRSAGSSNVYSAPREELHQKPSIVKTAGPARKRRTETAIRVMQSGSARLKTFLQSMKPGKVWIKWIILLTSALLLLGAALVFIHEEMDEGSSWSHRFKKQHHDKHHDRER
jgi:hypothetical protein